MAALACEVATGPPSCTSEAAAHRGTQEVVLHDVAQAVHVPRVALEDTADVDAQRRFERGRVAARRRAATKPVNDPEQHADLDDRPVRPLANANAASDEAARGCLTSRHMTIGLDEEDMSARCDSMVGNGCQRYSAACDPEGYVEHIDTRWQ